MKNHPSLWHEGVCQFITQSGLEEYARLFREILTSELEEFELITRHLEGRARGLVSSSHDTYKLLEITLVIYRAIRLMQIMSRRNKFSLTHISVLDN